MASCSSSSEYVAESVEFTEPSSSEGRPEAIDLEHAPLHPVEESPDSASRKFFVGHGGVLKQSSSTLEENDLESLSYECFYPPQGTVKDEVKRGDRRQDTRLDELEESMKKMKVQHSKQCKDIKEIKEELRTKNRQLKEKDEEIRQLKHELDHKDSQHKCELERKDSDMLEVKEELEKKKKMIAQLESERMQLHEDISSLKQDVTQLKEEMKNVQNQNSGLQCTVDQLQRKTEETSLSGKHQCVTKKELEEALHDYKGELVSTITKAMLDHDKAFIDSLTQTAITVAQAKVVTSGGSDKSCDYKSVDLVSKCGSELGPPDSGSPPSNTSENLIEHDSISDANNEEL